MKPLEVYPVLGMPEVHTGDDLAALIGSACAAMDFTLQRGDIVVVSSKVVSKAAGLWSTTRDAAIATGTVRVVAERVTATGVTRIVEAVAGPVMAAAGVDASNTGEVDAVLRLPDDSDAAACTLRAGLEIQASLPQGSIGVVVSDTAGRPWRSGQTDFALGACGVHVLDDLRGGVDADGRPLSVTARAVADELAAAADLVKGKTSAVPVAIVRGLAQSVGGATGARSLVRTGPGDWFRLGHVEAIRDALGVAAGSAHAQSAGMRALSAEDLRTRVLRALAVAAFGESIATQEVSVDGATVTVAGTDPYAAGRLVARLEVALASEDLRVHSSTSTGPDRVRWVVRVAPEGPTTTTP